MASPLLNTAAQQQRSHNPNLVAYDDDSRDNSNENSPTRDYQQQQHHETDAAAVPSTSIFTLAANESTSSAMHGASTVDHKKQQQQEQKSFCSPAMGHEDAPDENSNTTNHPPTVVASGGGGGGGGDAAAKGAGEEGEENTLNKSSNGLPNFINRFFDFIAIKNRKASHILVISTLILVPIFAILVNIFLSYRLDPAGFFYEHSTWNYTTTVKSLKTTYSGTWWTHKICSCTWTCTIVIQVLLVTHWGRVGGVHELLGFVVVMSAFLTATTGLQMENQHELRYDAFTKFFIYIASVVTYILCIGFFIARSFNISIKGWRLRHYYFGYPLMIPPVGMLMQFVFYSIGLLIESAIVDLKDSNNNDYTWWRVSLWLCMPVAIIITLLFLANTHYWRSRAACNHTLDELDGFLNPESERLDGCDCDHEGLRQAANQTRQQQQQTSSSSAAATEMQPVTTTAN